MWDELVLLVADERGRVALLVADDVVPPEGHDLQARLEIPAQDVPHPVAVAAAPLHALLEEMPAVGVGTAGHRAAVAIAGQEELARPCGGPELAQREWP